jgi:hypothetical protein
MEASKAAYKVKDGGADKANESSFFGGHVGTFRSQYSNVDTHHNEEAELEGLNEQQYTEFKINFARRFHEQYYKTILTIILLVVLKRILMKGGYVMFSELIVHISTFGIFFALSRVYYYSDFTTQYLPYVYALISYYSHTVFIFRGSFDEPANPALVGMSKDNLFRHIILVGALSFNLLYIGVFLVFNRKDCIMLNSMTLLLFITDVFRQEGK